MGGVTPNWLAQMAPSHAPPAPGWWPLAPGWWGLALLALLLAAVIAAVTYRQLRPQAKLRRAALRELAYVEANADGDAALARELGLLVRRFAVARYGRAAVAGLSGARWIDFVVAHGGAAWSGATGAALLQAAYGGASQSVQSVRAQWLAGARAFFKARK
jgi:hypothetical protein